MQHNLLQYLEATARRLPHKLAFSDGKTDKTFEEVLTDAERIGSYLLTFGAPTAPVPILMERGPMEICAFFGVIYAGGCYVPLDASMPDARMEKILSVTEATYILCDGKNRTRAETLAGDGVRVVCVDDTVSAVIDETALTAVREKSVETDPIYIVFTSGSTGTPKGVVACHRNVIDYAESLCDALPFTEETVFGNQTPLFFDAPLKEILPVIQLGATMYLVPKFLFSFPVRLVEFLNRYRINTICWVVSAMSVVSSLGTFSAVVPQYLTTVCFGSEVFPRPQYDLWRRTLPGAKFFNLYGPTEATGMSCYYPCERELAPDEPIPVGKPFCNTDVFLLTEDGKRADEGEVGEICMRGSCVTLGYYRDPERTAAAFCQNPLNTAYPERIYRTGDLGRFNAYGELVFLCRRDGQIKHMGHRIELGEIEAATAKLDGIRLCCCVYLPERKHICLYYTGTPSESDVLAHLRDEVPSYMVPAFVRRLDVMPQTPNGKLDRKALAQRAESEDI